MRKKKALLIDSINIPILIFCYLLKPFFSKVFFRYSKKKISIPFSKNFFVKIGYSGIDGSLFNKSYFLKKFLIRRYLARTFYKKIFFINFCKLINLDEKKINKLVFSFENFLYHNNVLSIDASSYVYSKKFLKDFSIIYAPNHISSYLLLSQIHQKSFKTISILAYLNTIIHFFRILIYDSLKIFIDKIKKKKFSNNNENIYLQIFNKNQIGYFPHKNLKYGSFFSKTFFLKNEKNSISETLGIDAIFFEKTDEVSERYLKIYKIQKIILKGKIPKNFLQFLIKYLVFVFHNRKFIKSNKITLLTFFLLFYFKIESFNTILKTSNYKYFFFYNDYIIPNSLLISAAVNKIKSISFQDRLTSYVYNNKIIFDYYFTCGSYFNKIFKEKYSAEKLIPIGLLRSNLIDENLIRNEKFLLKIKSIKKIKKVISLILITSTSEYKSDLYGEDGTSIKSLWNFENLICNLEKKFKDRIHILVKFKDKNFTYQEEFLKFEERLKKFNNVEIIKSDNINSANIISVSDIVIGSQSTIIEEALMKNKYSFILDFENFASTLGFYRYNNFYILKSIDNVIDSLMLLFNEDKKYIDNYNKNRKFFIENFLSDRGKINNFDTLRSKILNCINEELKN